MNRIIVVTGGAGGIGRCIIAHFASQGDSVYFIDQNQQATLTQVEKMRERGWQVTGFVGDVAEKRPWRNLQLWCFVNIRKVYIA